MSDLEKIQLMEELNWKPSQTYWKEEYDKKEFVLKRMKVLLRETYEMLDYDKNSPRYEACVSEIEKVLGITYE